MNEVRRINAVEGTGVVIRGEDIDTDRIIPARFLRSITFEDLAGHAFHDERFDAQGNPKPHPLNDRAHRDATVMIVNSNFGCGSSREHAPQSLLRSGIRGILGESFAEIFQGNCTGIGMVTACGAREEIARIMDLVDQDPQCRITLDLEEVSATAGGERFEITMLDSVRAALIEGTWDSTALLLQSTAATRKTAGALEYLRNFA